ncbi:hypothetical protein B7W89_12120 [Agrobacterium tumefaciens]|nr:hypothetical protein B7W89_12120 [Agrobacterium tumefaciens]
MSQESSRRASARREGSFQPKDLGWLDPCDKHRDEEMETRQPTPHSASVSTSGPFFVATTVCSYCTVGALGSL